MTGDYDLAMVTARCSRCARVVSASFGDLRETGIFPCVCGNMTRARYIAPATETPFSHAGWHDPSDSIGRSNWRRV